MTYALRLWVNDQPLVDSKTTDVEAAMTMFRHFISTPIQGRFYVSVTAHPTDAWPKTVAERSYTIASYQGS